MVGRRNLGSECEGGGEEGMGRKRGCVVVATVVAAGAMNERGDEGFSWSSWFSACRFAVRSWDGGDGVGEEERMTVSRSMRSAGLKRRRRLRAGDGEDGGAMQVGGFRSASVTLKPSSTVASCTPSSHSPEFPSSITSLAGTGNRGFGRGIPGRDGDGCAAEE